MRPPIPPTEPSAGGRTLDREHQAVSALAQAPVVMLVTISWRLWAARRSPAFRSAAASCQGDRCPSFSGLPAIARPITPLRQLGNGTRLIIVCLYASVRPRRLTPRLHAK